MKAIWSIVFLLVWLAGACPAAVDAHAYIETAIPRQESELKTPPGEIRVKFSEQINPSLIQLRLRNDSGQVIPGELAVEGNDWLVLKIPALSNGVYRVEWQVLSVDTHVTEGSYRFAVGVPLPAVRPAETVSLDDAPEQPASPESDGQNTVTQTSRETGKPSAPAAAPVAQPQQQPQPAKAETTIQTQRPAEQVKPKQPEPLPDTTSVPAPSPSEDSHVSQQQQETSVSKTETTVSEPVQVVDGSKGETQQLAGHQHHHHHHQHQAHDTWTRWLRLGEIAAASFAGGVLFLRMWPGFTRLLGERWRDGRTERTVYLGAFCLILVTETAQIWMLADMFNAETGMVDTIATVLASTSVGFAGWLRSLILATLFGLTFTNQSRAIQGAKALLATALMATFPLTGHAASDEGWASSAAHTIHFLAAVIWGAGLFGLLVLSFLLTGKKSSLQDLHHLMRQFSRVALISVAAIAATGVLLGVFRLSAWSQLGNTPYGLILSGKLALFIAALTLAALHRFVYLRRFASVSPERDVPSWLVWTLRAELLAAILLFILAGLLATTSPPASL